MNKRGGLVTKEFAVPSLPLGQSNGSGRTLLETHIFFEQVIPPLFMVPITVTLIQRTNSRLAWMASNSLQQTIYSPLDAFVPPAPYSYVRRIRLQLSIRR